jgi:hypothetical protein
LAADARRRRIAAALVSTASLKPPATLAIGAITAMAVIAMAALSAVLAVIVARDTCSGTGIEDGAERRCNTGDPRPLPEPVPARGPRVPSGWPVLVAIPADGNHQAIWDRSAGALAHDLGWTPECARSGTRPACRLAPAIQFVGYDGYPGHGSPRTCTGDCPAHLHLSWASPATAPVPSPRPAHG